MRTQVPVPLTESTVGDVGANANADADAVVDSAQLAKNAMHLLRLPASQFHQAVEFAKTSGWGAGFWSC